MRCNGRCLTPSMPPGRTPVEVSALRSLGPGQRARSMRTGAENYMVHSRIVDGLGTPADGVPSEGIELIVAGDTAGCTLSLSRGELRQRRTTRRHDREAELSQFNGARPPSQLTPLGNGPVWASC